MKSILILFALTISAFAQQKDFPSYDHDQPQNRRLGEPRRVLRRSPILPPAIGVDPCTLGRSWRGDEPPRILREQEIERRECLRKARRDLRRRR